MGSGWTSSGLQICEPDGTLVRFTNLQTRWGLPTCPSGLQIYFFWQPDGGGVRFTTYTPDDIFPKVHPVNIVWTGCLVVGSQILKKWQLNDLVRVSYQNLQKFIKIVNLTSLLFLAINKYYTMVENIFLPFNHLQNFKKRYYLRKKCRNCSLFH